MAVCLRERALRYLIGRCLIQRRLDAFALPQIFCTRGSLYNEGLFLESLTGIRQPQNLSTANCNCEVYCAKIQLQAPAAGPPTEHALAGVPHGALLLAPAGGLGPDPGQRPVQEAGHGGDRATPRAGPGRGRGGVRDGGGEEAPPGRHARGRGVPYRRPAPPLAARSHPWAPSCGAAGAAGATGAARGGGAAMEGAGEGECVCSVCWPGRRGGGDPAAGWCRAVLCCAALRWGRKQKRVWIVPQFPLAGTDVISASLTFHPPTVLGIPSLLLLGTYVDNAHVWELPSHQPGWLE